MSPVREINYVECDVPPGVTLSEWRRDRAVEARRPPSWLQTRRRAAVRALRRACGLG